MKRIKSTGLAAAMALTLVAVLGAASASATQFRAEEYPTAATASGAGAEQKVTLGALKGQCKTATASGTISAPSSALTLTPSFSSCKVNGINATVKFNSCAYVLNSTNEVAPYKGTLNVACSKGGDKIEIVQSATNCIASIPAQSGLSAVDLANTGKKSRGRTITATMNVTGLSYTQGSLCPEPGAYTNGVYTGNLTVSGYSSAPEHPVGVYLDTKQVVVPPVLEAEKYPAVIDATQHSPMIFGMGGSGFTCSATGTGQSKITGASTEFSVKFQKWTGCNLFGGFTLSMNGCSFALHPTVGELPYTSGSLGIACPVGKEITGTWGAGYCTVSIPAQSGLTSLTTENIGSGASRSMVANLNAKGVKYTQTGPACFNLGTHSDGTLSGSWDLTGFEYAGETVVEKEIVYLHGAQMGIWDE
jgi:hypothetical protein